MKVGDRVIDGSGHTGIVRKIWSNGQIQVQQKENVICTYDSKKQLKVI